MQEVLPGLYLGPYSAATKSRFKTLLDHGITHIICVRQTIESHMVRANFPHKIKYLVLDMADNPTQNLIMYLGECRSFIDECLVSGGKCLVHGNLGISRSAAIVVAYVMEKKNMTYKEALEFVQNRRYCINPNDGFKQQLREYEAIYRAQQTVLVNGQCSQDKGRLKRKHEQTIDWQQLSIEQQQQQQHEEGCVRLPQLDWSGSVAAGGDSGESFHVLYYCLGRLIFTLRAAKCASNICVVGAVGLPFFLGWTRKASSRSKSLGVPPSGWVALLLLGGEDSPPAAGGGGGGALSGVGGEGRLCYHTAATRSSSLGRYTIRDMSSLAEPGSPHSSPEEQPGVHTQHVTGAAVWVPEVVAFLPLL
ncbi:hypothetical protein Pmani_030574 [Petrolisthes manimaculis]|uniref:Serine/threonine/tyrosine-interacting protein n=1 Tax=Petrolisthes manimaculis TaxID=1843537 RepID=A0AAE1NVB9_9EUCA|nr:hypothetical protein Pmani_030574 [Petrolisthes manimaculis]